MGAQRSERRRSIRGGAVRWRWAISSGTAVAALAAILAMAPSATAMAPTHATVLSAPYHGTITSRSSSLFTSGCGGAQLTAGAFQLSTGLGSALSKASGPTCRGAGSDGYSDTGVSAGIHLPISSSKATVVVLAQMQAYVASHVTVGSCAINTSANYSYCYQSAYAAFYPFVYIIDTTSGSYFPSSNYFAGTFTDAYSDVFCYDKSCSSYSNTSGQPVKLSTTFAWWFNLTGLNAADHFQVSFGFYSYAAASEFAFGAKLTGGTTWAVANVATHGNGVDLASITIT